MFVVARAAPQPTGRNLNALAALSPPATQIIIVSSSVACLAPLRMLAADESAPHVSLKCPFPMGRRGGGDDDDESSEL